jgi:hypothetical protein
MRVCMCKNHIIHWNDDNDVHIMNNLMRYPLINFLQLTSAFFLRIP